MIRKGIERPSEKKNRQIETALKFKFGAVLVIWDSPFYFQAISLLLMLNRDSIKIYFLFIFSLI